MLWAAPAKYCIGQLLGGDAGAVEIAAVAGEMRSWGVKDPAKFVNVFAAGFRV